MTHGGVGLTIQARLSVVLQLMHIERDVHHTAVALDYENPIRRPMYFLTDGTGIIQCLASRECSKDVAEERLLVGSVVRVTNGLVNILPHSDTGVYILLGMEVLGVATTIVGDPKVGGPSILKVLSSKSCDLVTRVAHFVTFMQKTRFSQRCMLFW